MNLVEEFILTELQDLEVSSEFGHLLSQRFEHGNAVLHVVDPLCTNSAVEFASNLENVGDWVDFDDLLNSLKTLPHRLSILELLFSVFQLLVSQLSLLFILLLEVSLNMSAYEC